MLPRFPPPLTPLPLVPVTWHTLSTRIRTGVLLVLSLYLAPDLFWRVGYICLVPPPLHIPSFAPDKKMLLVLVLVLMLLLLLLCIRA